MSSAKTDGPLFSGRVAAITGAGKGLGRSYALWLASQGCAVVVNNRTHPGVPSSAQALANEITELGGTAVAHDGSVDDPAAASGLVSRAVEAFGKLDILVCNAGIMPEAPFAETSQVDIEKVVSINVLGTIYPLQQAWAHMLERGYGRVVLSGSTVGVYGFAGAAVYGATRCTAIGLARSLTLEIPPGTDIGVNVIMPFAYTNMSSTAIDAAMPSTVTEMIQPDKIAPFVGWLCSEDNYHRGRIFHASALKASRIGIVESAVTDIDPNDISSLSKQGFCLEPVFEPEESTEAAARLLGG